MILGLMWDKSKTNCDIIPCYLSNFWICEWLYIILPNLLELASNPSVKS